MIVGAGSSTSAHRRDEYLQAARIAIDPDRVRVEVDLTAGIAVADAVLAGIDADRDGAISAGEAQAYASVVRQSVRIDVDETPLVVALASSELPDVAALRGGEGPIRVVLLASMPPLGPGRHQIRYRNAHRADIGVYLANALVPASDRVAINGQQRDAAQRELIVDYELRPSRPGSGALPFAASLGVAVLVLGALWWRRRSA